MAKQPAGSSRRIFNLLKPYTPPATGWDKVYEFIVSRARIVLLVVELIVIVSFVGKVVVDTEAKRLDDEIKLADRQLQTLQQSIEPSLRLLQDKSEVYRRLWNQSNSYTAVSRELNTILSNIGTSLIVNISEDKVVISGQNDLAVLSQIEDLLKRSNTFSGTVVNRLDAGGSGGVGNYILETNINQLNQRTQL